MHTRIVILFVYTTPAPQSLSLDRHHVNRITINVVVYNIIIIPGQGEDEEDDIVPGVRSVRTEVIKYKRRDGVHNITYYS